MKMKTTKVSWEDGLPIGGIPSPCAVLAPDFLKERKEKELIKKIYRVVLSIESYDINEDGQEEYAETIEQEGHSDHEDYRDAVSMMKDLHQLQNIKNNEK